MLRIVIDSAGDMPSDWLEKYDVQVIPINIHFDEEMYLQGIDLSNDDFYSLVEQSGTIPKTSQPTPQQFIDFYTQIADPGDTILSIHVTSKLSGTFESAEIAARELENDFDVIPFDSAAGSVAQGFMARAARQMDGDGANIDEILKHLSWMRSHTEIILTLDTLEYARMSGRVAALQAALASVLNVKPIILLEDGVLDMFDKVRTRSRSVERVLELIKERIGNQLTNMAVVHAGDQSAGQELLEKVADIFNCETLILSELSIGVAANLGPGTLGIIACPV